MGGKLKIVAFQVTLRHFVTAVESGLTLSLLTFYRKRRGSSNCSGSPILVTMASLNSKLSLFEVLESFCLLLPCAGA